MKTIGSYLIRIVIIGGIVTLITTGAYFTNGGTTAQGLSDWLVNASFLTLGLGTVFGITRMGTKGMPGGVEGDTELQGYIRELFRAGPFGIAFTLAGVACFIVAILVDGFF
jgi:hypothetical protein